MPRRRATKRSRQTALIDDQPPTEIPELAAASVSVSVGTSPVTKKRKLNNAKSKAATTKTNKGGKKEALSKEEKMEANITRMKKREVELTEKEGYQYIVGVDEAGRGPLAGPVVVGCCYVPLDIRIAGIADSKALTEDERESLFEQIINHPNIDYSVVAIDHTAIEELNILGATLKGMRDCVTDLQRQLDSRQTNTDNDSNTDATSTTVTQTKNSKKSKRKSKRKSQKSSEETNDKSEETSENQTKIDMVLVDGNRDPIYPQSHIKCETVVKGDANIYCIAAASIIAKVTRDRLMYEYDKQWPEYEFATHKGYPTATHRAMVAKHGPCDIHRKTFKGVREYLPTESDAESQSDDESKDKTKSSSRRTKRKSTKASKPKKKAKKRAAKVAQTMKNRKKAAIGKRKKKAKKAVRSATLKTSDNTTDVTKSKASPTVYTKEAPRRSKRLRTKKPVR